MGVVAYDRWSHMEVRLMIIQYPPQGTFFSWAFVVYIQSTLS